MKPSDARYIIPEPLRVELRPNKEGEVAGLKQLIKTLLNSGIPVQEVRDDEYDTELVIPIARRLMSGTCAVAGQILNVCPDSCCLSISRPHMVRNEVLVWGGKVCDKEEHKLIFAEDSESLTT